MDGTIDDFLETLPETDKEGARRICQEANDVEKFPRIELTSAYELSRVGIKMVYAISRGPIIYGGVSKQALFYLSTMPTRSFFGEEDLKDSQRVDAVPVERIHGIKELDSTERTYSRDEERV